MSSLLLISRGIFNKGLDFTELHGYLFIMAAEIFVISGIGIMLQKKQES